MHASRDLGTVILCLRRTKVIQKKCENSAINLCRSILCDLNFYFVMTDLFWQSGIRFIDIAWKNDLLLNNIYDDLTKIATKNF